MREKYRKIKMGENKKIQSKFLKIKNKLMKGKIRKVRKQRQKRTS